MITYPIDFHVFAIQRKTFVRVEVKAPYPKNGSVIINQIPIYKYL